MDITSCPVLPLGAISPVMTWHDRPCTNIHKQMRDVSSAPRQEIVRTVVPCSPRVPLLAQEHGSCFPVCPSAQGPGGSTESDHGLHT